MGQNLRYALRSLLRTPGFTVAALVCLALGIGATSAIFSIVNAVVLRPLPYRDSDRLVRLYTEFPNFPHGGLRKFWVSAPELFDLKSAKSFSAIGGWYATGANLSGSAEPLRVTTAFVTADGLRLLQEKPLMGRLFRDEDDKRGAPNTIILSNSLWKRGYGADPNIIGRELYLNNEKCTVIGVMPSRFVFPPGEIDPAEAWAPLQLDPATSSRASHFLSVFARLRPNVTLAQARNEVAQLVARWGEADSPKYHALSPKNHPVVMYSFYDEVVGGIRKAILLLLGAVLFVLLIACVNVANLLLARSEVRQREIAIRRALGASTGRMLQQFITEGAVLSLGGALIGVLLAWGALRLTALSNAGSIPRADEISLDWTVVAFTLGVSLITALLFGLAPMVNVSALRLFETLKASSTRASGSLSSENFRRVLVIVETALACVLLVGSTVMVKGFLRLQDVHSGINPQGLLTASLSLPQATYRDAAAQTRFWTLLQDRLSQIPGVESSTLASGLPPLRRMNENDTKIEGFVPVRNGPMQSVTFYQTVGRKFFETLGIRLVEGRFLDERDTVAKAPGLVVNQAMARTFWPGQSPIGKRIQPDFEPPWYTVVGVVADVKNAGLDKPTGTEIFMAYKSSVSNGDMRSPQVIIKTPSDPRALAGAVRSAIASIDPSLPVAKVRTMENVMADANSRPRFLTLVFTMFSALALALAIVGIYGVISYSVAQRTTEFGIKMALGAEPSRLLFQVLRQGLMLGVIGIAAGCAGAALLTRWLEGIVFGATSADLSSFGLTTVALLVATLAASYVPAARAMRIMPIAALRYE